jgi:hypothetical protein
LVEEGIGKDFLKKFILSDKNFSEKVTFKKLFNFYITESYTFVLFKFFLLLIFLYQVIMVMFIAGPGDFFEGWNNLNKKTVFDVVS